MCVFPRIAQQTIECIGRNKFLSAPLLKREFITVLHCLRVSYIRRIFSVLVMSIYTFADLFVILTPKMSFVREIVEMEGLRKVF